MITRRQLLIASGAGLIAAPLTSIAQQSGKIYRIGMLHASEPPAAYAEAFLQALKALGYIEGKNIAFETRVAGGREDRLPALAAELVRLKVDLITADTGAGIRAARDATSTIPIVMLASGDPIASGFIASLARPGGNVTGVTNMNINLGAKLLEVLKDMVPNLGHVGLLKSPSRIAEDFLLKNTQASAQALKIKVTPLIVRGPEDYAGAFQTAAKARAQALLVSLPPATADDRKQIIDLATRSGLPAIYEARVWTEAGGLISYGAERLELRRRAATYVDKILKGAKPADLPVEQPTKFELVVNLKTAKALGFKFPPSVLVRADKVIE
jgi:putative ABC transport system substrate-binding protein